MGDEHKSRSARRSWRTLFASSDDAPPSSPPRPLVMLPQSQPSPNSTNLLPSPQRIKSPAPEMDEGTPSHQQPSGGDLSPATATSFSDNGGVQQEEKVKKDLAAGEKKKAMAMAKGERTAARVWSVQDEVRILERLAAFVKAKGAPPNRSQLHGVLHGHLPDKKEFTLTQIYEKVRGLKNRYYAMRTKAAAGAPPIPGDADEELRKYELSAQIWGDSLPLPKPEPKETAPRRQAGARREFEELQEMYPYLTLLVEEEIAAGDRGFLKRAFEFIDDGKARQLDAKVKNQRISEMMLERDRSSAQREVLRALMGYMA